MEKIYVNAALCLIGSCSTVSQAACTFLSGSAADGETVKFSNVVVQRDTAIGTTLATVTSDRFGSRGNFLQCDRPSPSTVFVARWSTSGFTMTSLNGEQLITTGVSGIAMRIKTPGTGYTFPFTGPFPRDVTNTGQPGCFWNSVNIWYCGNNWGPTTFELVKIANVTGSGALTLSGQVEASLVGLASVYHFNFGTSSVSTVACSVTNTSIVVPMGNVSTKDLTSVGTTTPEKNFNIPLDCDVGTRVRVMLNGTPHGSGITGVLALDTATTTVATGVGLQLLYNSAPVTLGTSILVGTVASSGTYNIGLTARYYQTAATVTAGQANSTATFTMIYN